MKDKYIKMILDERLKMEERWLDFLTEESILNRISENDEAFIKCMAKVELLKEIRDILQEMEQQHGI